MRWRSCGRMWDGAPHVELEWTIGPIPVNDDLGVHFLSCERLFISGVFDSTSLTHPHRRRPRCVFSVIGFHEFSGMAFDGTAIPQRSGRIFRHL